MVDFRILGPVEVWAHTRSVQLGGPKPRALLAALLLNAGRVVTVERLIDAVWPDRPPDSASALIQTYISALRKKLTEAGKGEAIRTCPPGYLIDLGAGQLDSEVFESLVAEGRRHSAGDRPETAAAAFRSALGLWRGPALGGVGDGLRAEAARLEELKLSATEERITADLALGREAEIIGEVRALVTEHPTRERLRAQLMIALYRLGMQAEALAVFQQGRELLVSELGIDPGPELRAVHEAVLRGDDDVLGFAWTWAVQSWQIHPWRTRPTQPRRALTTVAPVPSQLPPALADFTGRAAQLNLLMELLSPHRTVPICVISGPGGAGKSALAVYVAHQVAEEFPDGQIFVDLRGMAAAPATPEEVLMRLLRELGAEPSTLPATTEELAARYRSLLAGRRVLLVLDDAFDEKQIRPLLPGGLGCAVLITSRNRLAGLAGAHLIELGVLSPAEGIDLLTRIVGADRVRREEEAAEQIVKQCGHLPLAIRIAGTRLAIRPAWSLALMAERLTDESRRLGELAVGDQTMQASIELSYRALGAEAKRALRVMGMLGLPDFAAWTVEAALELPRGEGERVVELLIDAQLVDVAGIDALGQLRYRLHDLVRLFARERADAEESSRERVTAVHRVVGGWLWLVERIAAASLPDAVRPRGTSCHAVPVDPTVAAAVLADPRSWLEAENDALIVGVQLAATMELDGLVKDLVSTLCATVCELSEKHGPCSRQPG